eukprot:TRINITY_DN9875_c0_g1_i2.p1 TRINITY_DN9875_c0_g1~~TRINITY_DN9875_c0_g1_i2.p1  ORF type:complete len:639 (+),score=112.76 TRINITY_DN9875_c0_g1_i2:156-2072(+)
MAAAAAETRKLQSSPICTVSLARCGFSLSCAVATTSGHQVAVEEIEFDQASSRDVERGLEHDWESRNSTCLVFPPQLPRAAGVHGAFKNDCSDDRHCRFSESPRPQRCMQVPREWQGQPQPVPMSKENHRGVDSDFNGKIGRPCTASGSEMGCDSETDTMSALSEMRVRSRADHSEVHDNIGESQREQATRQRHCRLERVQGLLRAGRAFEARRQLTKLESDLSTVSDGAASLSLPSDDEERLRRLCACIDQSQQPDIQKGFSCHTASDGVSANGLSFAYRLDAQEMTLVSTCKYAGHSSLRALAAFCEVDLCSGFKPNVTKACVLSEAHPAEGLWRVHQKGMMSGRKEDNIVHTSVVDALDEVDGSIWVYVGAPFLEGRQDFCGVMLPVPDIGTERITHGGTLCRITPLERPEASISSSSTPTAGFELTMIIRSRVPKATAAMPSFLLRVLIGKGAQKSVEMFRTHLRNCQDLDVRLSDGPRAELYEQIRRHLAGEKEIRMVSALTRPKQQQLQQQQQQQLQEQQQEEIQLTQQQLQEQETVDDDKQLETDMDTVRSSHLPTSEQRLVRGWLEAAVETPAQKRSSVKSSDCSSGEHSPTCLETVTTYDSATEFTFAEIAIVAHAKARPVSRRRRHFQ